MEEEYKANVSALTQESQHLNEKFQQQRGEIMEALADANAKLRRTQEKLATDNNGKTKWKKNTVSSLLL